MRTRLPISLLFVLPIVVSPAAAERTESAETCATVDACLERLHAIATERTPSGGAARGAFPLAHRLATMPESVAPVVALLAHPDERVADIASIVLREAPAIAPEHLPAIRAGLDRDLGWLAPALAAIPGEAAAREAVARVLAEGETSNQEGYAIQRLGARAVPPLLEAAHCRDGCARSDVAVLSSSFARLGEAARPAAPALLAIAADPATPRDTAAGALRMLVAIGNHAAVAEPGLLALRDAKPELRHEIDDVLVAVGGEPGGAVLADRLGRGVAETRVIQEIAALGPAGVAAGPALLALLSGDAADRALAAAPPAMFAFDDAAALRVAAARALGAVGYRPAVPRLLEALDDPRDVRLNWAAAEALGRLAPAEATGALEGAAASHWYPPVRAQAASSLQAIRAGVPAVPEDEQAWGRFESIPGVVEGCEAPPEGVQDAAKLYGGDEADARELQRLRYDSEVVSYGAADEDAQRAATPAGKTPIVNVTADNIVEHRQRIRIVPAVALPVPGGWLAGGNRGEWGGELMFLPATGTPVKLWDGNVEDIYRFGDGWVATVGIAHMSLNEGEVLKIARDAGGRWSATPWRTLPGAPFRSWPLPGGELLIDVYDGGTLLLSPDGRFRMASCAPVSPTAESATERAAADAAAEAEAAAAAAAAAAADE